MTHRTQPWIRATMVVVLLVSLLPSRSLFGGAVSPSPQAPQHTQEGTGGCSQITQENAVDCLRVKRVIAEDLVLRVKGSPTPHDPKAEQLYDRARHYYNAYVDAVLSDLITGRQSDLNELASRASAAMEQFEKYVEEKTQVRSLVGALVVLAPVLVDIGLKVWERFTKTEDHRRKIAVEQLRRQLEWREWNVI